MCYGAFLYANVARSASVVFASTFAVGVAACAVWVGGLHKDKVLSLELV
jgi:hypothetical protein